MKSKLLGILLCSSSLISATGSTVITVAAAQAASAVDQLKTAVAQHNTAQVGSLLQQASGTLSSADITGALTTAQTIQQHISSEIANTPTLQKIISTRTGQGILGALLLAFGGYSIYDAIYVPAEGSSSETITGVVSSSGFTNGITSGGAGGILVYSAITGTNPTTTLSEVEGIITQLQGAQSTVASAEAATASLTSAATLLTRTGGANSSAKKKKKKSSSQSPAAPAGTPTETATEE